MAKDAVDRYLSEIDKAYLREDATEHTHRPALRGPIEAMGEIESLRQMSRGRLPWGYWTF